MSSIVERMNVKEFKEKLNEFPDDIEHFEVPEPVYVLIRQLEAEILLNKGVVQRLYKDRFTNNPNAPESDA
jgi:hypothetical protein